MSARQQPRRAPGLGTAHDDQGDAEILTHRERLSDVRLALRDDRERQSLLEHGQESCDVNVVEDLITRLEGAR